MAHHLNDHLEAPMVLDEIIDGESSTVRRRLGIFVYDDDGPYPLDFVFPEYVLSKERERELRLMGFVPNFEGQRPVLNVYFGIKHDLLEPAPRPLTEQELVQLRKELKILPNQFNPTQPVHRVVGRLDYKHGGFFNQGHDVYVTTFESLKKAGFLV